jgi:hypothetical protein
MATLLELLKRLDRDEVVAAISVLYPNTKPGSLIGYRNVWDTLLATEPVKTSMVCEIYMMGLNKGWLPDDVVKLLVPDGFDDDEAPFPAVHGRDGEKVWAIEFVPWPQWLGMEVTVAPEVGEISETDAVAHILWEMTYVGYDNDTIQKKLQKIVDAVDDIKDSQ